MKGLFKGVKRFLVSEDGAVATEYAVMLALIIIVALGAIGGLGTSVQGLFSTIDAEVGGGP